jgi:hypothetical protein
MNYPDPFCPREITSIKQKRQKAKGLIEALNDRRARAPAKTR